MKISIVSDLVAEQSDTVPSCMVDKSNEESGVSSCLVELEVNGTGPHIAKRDSETSHESQILAEPSAIDPEDNTRLDGSSLAASPYNYVEEDVMKVLHKEQMNKDDVTEQKQAMVSAEHMGRCRNAGSVSKKCVA